MGWTRVELKSYAKDFLRRHYWKAFIVCLIFTLLTGGSDNSSDSNTEVRYTEPSGIESQYDDFRDNTILETGRNGLIRFLGRLFTFPIMIISTSVFAFIAGVLVLISIIIGPLITVGKNRFFLEGFKGDARISYLFSTFNRDEAWGIFKCIFITNIKNFLWFLLLIVPGIIKSYEYRMVSYLLVEDPNLTSGEAIEISRNLTDGHKWDMFVLDLSFLGWYLLGALLFGIGMFFVTPYEEATLARLFNVLSGNDEDTDNDFDVVYE